MKKIFKLLPAALGLVALTSCSSDDLFGDSKTVDLSDKLVVTVTEEDDVVTRTARDANQKVAYEVGDQLRVYDSKLQAYDNFAYAEAGLEKPTFILSADEAKVAKREDGKFDYAYAILGSPAGANNVSYSGWQNGDNVALLKIENSITYSEATANTATGNNQVVYKATLPQWGTVEPVVSEVTKTAKSFNTSLRYLTGRAKVVFQNGQGADLKSVRVRSLRFAKAGDAVTATLKGDAVIVPNPASQNNILAVLTRDANVLTATATINGTDDVLISQCLVEDTKKPLAGWFEAILDPTKNHDGMRQITDATGAVTPAAGAGITINVPSVDVLEDYTNVFFFPIVPDTYEILLFEYNTNGSATYKTIGYRNGAVARGEKIEGDDLTLRTTLEINKDNITTTLGLSQLMAKNTIEGAPVTLNVNTNAGTLATINDVETEGLYTIVIPQLKNDMIVNLNTTPVDITAHNLIIKDAVGANNAAYKLVLNFAGGMAATTKTVSVNTTAQFALAGDMDACTGLITVAAANGLTIGNSGVASTTLNDVTVTAGDVTIVKKTATEVEDLIAAGNVNIKGDATSITADGTVDVVDGTIGTITAEGKVTITAGTITNIASNTVEIKGGTVTNWQLADANATITMTGGKLTNTLGNAGALAADRTVTFNTSGASEFIGTAVAEDGGAGTTKYKYTFSSTLDNAAIDGVGGITATNKIYTAAQLYKCTAASAAAMNLYTDVTVTGSKFASLTVTTGTSFVGNGHTISGLKKALFATLSIPVSGLKLTNVEIEAAAANVGALANNVSIAANTTISDVTVSGTKIGAKYDASGNAYNVYNVGGLFGQVTNTAAATLTIEDCGVTLTEAIQGYYNLGGYIGLAKGGTAALGIAFTKTEANKNLSSIAAFKKTFWANLPIDTNCGKVGMFIGGIDGSAKQVNITIGDNTIAKNFNQFFSGSDVITNIAKVTESAQAGSGSLEFPRNYTGDNTGKYFLGMKDFAYKGTNIGLGQLIGFSKGDFAFVTVYGDAAIELAAAADPTDTHNYDLTDKDVVANIVNNFHN